MSHPPRQILTPQEQKALQAWCRKDIQWRVGDQIGIGHGPLSAAVNGSQVRAKVAEKIREALKARAAARRKE